jgi:hypothetical protein
MNESVHEPDECMNDNAQQVCYALIFKPSRWFHWIPREILPYRHVHQNSLKRKCGGAAAHAMQAAEKTSSGDSENSLRIL